ncbi:MAG TPA: endonuclease/exonuclease/phosphatase family protein [Gammaproteobacteria bacterium]|nr:endonuclease/exonuclease/phosphatase family protein [Gammaproteobacteria bacterium]
MRFILYNIRYGTGSGAGFHLPFPGSGYLRNTRRNIERIAGFIGEYAPDVVGLLEVDTGSYRIGRKNNQAQLLAEALGHNATHQIKYGIDSFNTYMPVLNKQGNAFLTSRSVTATRFHYFDAGIKRLIIELELEQVSIFLVHLSLKFRHRHYQLRHLHELIKNTGKPVILAGDFNTLWGDYEIDLFRDATGLVSANIDGAPSYPSWRPKRQLDFILHSPSLRVNNFEVPQVRYSDHLPLICDFETGAEMPQAKAIGE